MAKRTKRTVADVADNMRNDLIVYLGQSLLPKYGFPDDGEHMYEAIQAIMCSVFKRLSPERAADFELYAAQNSMTLPDVLREALEQFYEVSIGTPEDNAAYEAVKEKYEAAHAL